MAEPPFLGLERGKGGSVFSEGRTTRCVFGVQGYQEGKCAVVPRKLRDQRKVLRSGAPEKRNVL